MTLSALPPGRSSSGFTLIELMVVVAIVAILASIAYPSFTEQIRKSRRSDAVAALTGIRHAQERFRANNPTYAANVADLNLSATSHDGHYDLAIAPDSATPRDYTAVASARTASPQYHDVKCRSMQLKLNDLRGTMIQGSTNASGVLNEAAGNPCWIN